MKQVRGAENPAVHGTVRGCVGRPETFNDAVLCAAEGSRSFLLQNWHTHGQTTAVRTTSGQQKLKGLWHCRWVRDAQRFSVAVPLATGERPRTEKMLGSADEAEEPQETIRSMEGPHFAELRYASRIRTDNGRGTQLCGPRQLCALRREDPRFSAMSV